MGECAADKAWLEQLTSLTALPQQISDAFKRGKLIKVIVNKNERSWKVSIALRDLVSRRQLDHVAAELGKAVGFGVSFNVDYDLQMSPEQLSESWELALEEICFCFPWARNWLKSSRCIADKQRIKIGVASEMSKEILEQKDFCRALGTWLSKTMAIGTGVELFCDSEHLDPQELRRDYLAQVKVDLPVNGNGGGGPRQGRANKKKIPAPGVIKGRQIGQAAVVPLQEIREEEKSIVVLGQVVAYEVRTLKSERRLVLFNLTDNTDSISVKAFAKQDEDWMEKINKGDWLKVRGSVQHDTYTQELTLYCYDINVAVPEERCDNAPSKRVELHLHTKMSSLDAVVNVRDAVATAAKWGHPAVAVTDHGVIQAFPDAYAAGQEFGIKIIYGLEGYLVEEGWQKGSRDFGTYHITLLVRNAKGLENLYRLVSRSHLDYFYRKPLLPRNLIEQHREGLLLGTACEAGELIQSYIKGAGKDELLRIAGWYDYIEIQPGANNQFLVRQGTMSETDLEQMNRTLIELGEQLRLPVAAAGDVHFLHPWEDIYRKILMSGQGYEDLEQAPLYLRTTEEMLDEFGYLGKDTAHRVVVEAPAALAADIEEIQPIPSETYPPKIAGADDQIREMAVDTARKLYGDPLPEVVRRRLDRELDAIINNGFAVLYLIAHKLVKKSNDDGYLVGSRGSVGSSFVATMTGITEVNPLPPHYRCGSCKYHQFIEDGSVNSGVDLADKQCPECGQMLTKDGHDIPFEVFMGFKGDKVPDIDLNFSGDYQPQAHRFTEELFGKEHVFRAGTIATIAERTAFGFVKNYFKDQGLPVRTAELNRLVGGISGVKRTTGQHPGGLMVVPQDLDVHMFSPVQRPADDTASQVITTHFDYHAISSRLVKLDILGHDDPTVIKMLEDLTGLDARSIPLDEPKTMSLFSGTEALGVSAEEIRSQVGTYGIPEFGTRFVRQMLVDTQPKHFSDLVRISGLSHGTDVWLNNAQELIRSHTANISQVISTRDDIMVYLIYKGLPKDISFRIMEDVRKGKGLKDEYVEQMKAYGVPQWYIDSCNKIKYMFPKAHAVAYVTMAYRIAYCKVYYPAQFYATFFTVRADQFDAQLICRGREVIEREIELLESKGNEASQKEKSLLTILEVALEMYCRGISLLRVDLSRSDAQSFLITEAGLLPPFASLQGVGEQVAQNIVTARGIRPFSSIEDLKVRGRVSSAVLDILKEHGTLDDLPPSDQMALF